MRLGFAPITVYESGPGSAEVTVRSDAYVSQPTMYRMGKGLPGWEEKPRARYCHLSIREQGSYRPIGLSADGQGDDLGFLVFSMNPKMIRMQQNARVSVQQGRNGYVVMEAGLSELRFILEGNFGSMIKATPVPTSFYTKDSAGSTNQSESFKSNQTYDGQQGWLKLRNLVKRYFEANQRRAKEGKDPIEMVWSDPMHGDDGKSGLRWVVVPSAMPTFDRETNKQGILPYRLELIGVYDDTKPVAAANNKIISLIPKAPLAFAPPDATAVTITAPVTVITLPAESTIDEVPTIPILTAPRTPPPPQEDSGLAILRRVTPKTYDFRTTSYAQSKILQMIVDNGYTYAVHIAEGGTAESFVAGINTLAFRDVPDHPIYHENSESARGRAQKTFNLAIAPVLYIKIKQRLAKKLSPWGTKLGGTGGVK